MNNAFNVGDVVRLKSGGQKMTVNSELVLNQNPQGQPVEWINVIWFNLANQVMTYNINPGALKLVEDDEVDA
jgi:hypothetical protein